MLKRDAGRGALELARPGRPFGPPARLRALFAAEAATLQIDGGDMLPLPAYALAWSDDAHGSWRIVGETRPRAWWIHFEPA
jgi:hypothetical protein